MRFSVPQILLVFSRQLRLVHLLPTVVGAESIFGIPVLQQFETVGIGLLHDFTHIVNTECVGRISLAEVMECVGVGILHDSPHVVGSERVARISPSQLFERVGVGFLDYSPTEEYGVLGHHVSAAPVITTVVIAIVIVGLRPLRHFQPKG